MNKHDSRLSLAPPSHALRWACQRVMQESGINPELSPADDSLHVGDQIAAFCLEAGVMYRKVELKGCEWWRSDAGPVLAFDKTSQDPLVLLPRGNSGYSLLRPDGKTAIKVDGNTASGLDLQAYSFFRTLPEKKLRIRDLLAFGFRGTGPDIRRLALFGILGGFLGVMIPAGTGLLIDKIIPGAMLPLLVQLAFLLVTAAVGMSCFEIVRAISMKRIDTRVGWALESAVLHRVLHLPAPFFRNYSAGDLAQRTMGITWILYALSNNLQAALLGWIFGLFSYAYLFFLSPGLALTATLLVLVTLILTFAVNAFRLLRERQLTDLEGRVAGDVFQLFSAIEKIRAAGSEKRAYARWAAQFDEQNRLSFRIGRAGNILESFNAGFVVLSTAALFAMVGDTDGMAAGTFVAFYAAFALFLTATLSMAKAVTASLKIIPVYERAKPILSTLPETSSSKGYPTDLRGEVAMTEVSFCYEEKGPLVVDKATLTIAPGEWVAIVGLSGSGKSTLMRLMLGLEKPDSGTITFDGMDLEDIDKTRLRRHLGVVLQNSEPLACDILGNITGSADTSMDEAWEGARMAGIAEDIKAMPLGMKTPVIEGPGNISGGQKQRLMIARAIAKKPQIFLFDEATSALDNHTQAIVADNIANLKATRVVIAHRLSTIKGADRIVVIDRGRIVETGTYEELMNKGEYFARLASPQLT